MVGGCVLHRRGSGHASIHRDLRWPDWRAVFTRVAVVPGRLCVRSFEELAGFGNLTYRFNEIVDLTVGLRYSHNEQTQLQTLTGLLTGDSSRSGRVERQFADVSDHAAVSISPTTRCSTCASPPVIGRAARTSRSWACRARTTPSEVTNYEVGLKTELLDRRLSLDVSAFYIDWKDIQLNERNAQNLNYFGNGGAAESKGVEARRELAADCRVGPLGQRQPHDCRAGCRPAARQRLWPGGRCVADHARVERSAQRRL